MHDNSVRGCKNAKAIEATCSTLYSFVRVSGCYVMYGLLWLLQIVRYKRGAEPPRQFVHIGWYFH